MRKFLLVNSHTPWIDRQCVDTDMIIEGVNDQGGEIIIKYDIVTKEWNVFSKKTLVQLFRFVEWKDLFELDICKAFMKGYKLYYTDYSMEVAGSMSLSFAGERITMQINSDNIELAKSIADTMNRHEDFANVIAQAAEIYITTLSSR